jgi:chromosome segregation ATPase
MSGDDVLPFVLAVGAVVAALVGGVAAWRKLKPESAQIVVTSAEKVTDMSLRFAGTVGAENDQLFADITALRTEFDQYRRDADAEMAALRAEVRGYKAENRTLTRERDQLRAENAQLSERVSKLEGEVARLEALVPPSGPSGT